MNRSTEVEILATTLEEPAKGFLRASITAQKCGRLDSAARVARDHLLRRPSLSWPTLLLALDDAELRLGGSVRIETPRTRFAAKNDTPLFEERWGPFGCTVWPEGFSAKLQIVRDRRHEIELRTATPTPSASMSEALKVLSTSLEDYFGVRVCRVAVSVPLFEADHEE